MSKEPNWKLQELNVIDVRARPDFQNRVQGTERSHTKSLVRKLEGGEVLEPIEVAQVGKALYVVDGFHRLEAHGISGRDTINAKVARMKLEEAKDRALRSNTKHGKNLSRADKAAMFSKYVERGNHVWKEGDDIPPNTMEGATKSGRIIEAELGHIYRHPTILSKLKERGIEIDHATEYPHGYKAFGEGERSEAELAAERLEDADTALWNFQSLCLSLETDDQKRLLEDARRILKALEDGKSAKRNNPNVAAVGVLDI